MDKKVRCRNVSRTTTTKRISNNCMKGGRSHRRRQRRLPNELLLELASFMRMNNFLVPNLNIGPLGVYLAKMNAHMDKAWRMVTCQTALSLLNIYLNQLKLCQIFPKFYELWDR